jgi:hypothetical protein
VGEGDSVGVEVEMGVVVGVEVEAIVNGQSPDVGLVEVSPVAPFEHNTL